MNNFLTELQNSFLLTFLYDMVKFILAYLAGRYIVSRYKLWKYGGWRLIVKEGELKKVDRKITVPVRERIEDRNELSVYVKGVVSPYAHLNLDIISDESVNRKLLTIDENAKEYIVNLEMNPTIERRPDIAELIEHSNQLRLKISQLE